MEKHEEIALRVRDIMVEDVAYVTVPGTREDVMAIFKKRGISGVPVIKDDIVVGVVTRYDLLQNPEEDQIALLMSRNPIVIKPDATIAEAAKIISSLAISRLPVVDGSKLIGLLTIADFIREISSWDDKTPIDSYIGDKTTALWDEMPLPLAGRLMELARVRAVPVLNSSFMTVGIITDLDLMKVAIIEESIGSRDISSGSDGDEWSLDGLRDRMKLHYGISQIRLPDKLVKDVMVKDVVTVTRKSGVSASAQKMCEGRFNQLPVTSARGKLLGMLTDKDLLSILL